MYYNIYINNNFNNKNEEQDDTTQKQRGDQNCRGRELVVTYISHMETQQAIFMQFNMV